MRGCRIEPVRVCQKDIMLWRIVLRQLCVAVTVAALRLRLTVGPCCRCQRVRACLTRAVRVSRKGITLRVPEVCACEIVRASMLLAFVLENHWCVCVV